MKKIIAILMVALCVISALPVMEARAAEKYGVEVNFKPTSSSKAYESSAAGRLGITLYESPYRTLTSFETAITLQRVLNEVNARRGLKATPEKSIKKFINYKSMSDYKIIRQMHYVGALDVKYGKILVKTKCTRLELARQLSYYDEYFGLYLKNDTIKIEDTHSAYAKYAYQAGLMNLADKKFKPEGKIALKDLLVILERITKNNSLGVTKEDVKNALVKTYKCIKNAEDSIKEYKADPGDMCSFGIEEIEKFDEFVIEDPTLAEVQVIDVTNSQIIVSIFNKEGIATLSGISGTKKTPLFKIKIGDGVDNVIVLKDITLSSGTSKKMELPSGFNETLQWGSSDPTVATVKNGVVTGVAGGTCEITVYSKTCLGKAVVTVISKSFEVSTSELQIKEGGSYKIAIKEDGRLTSSYTSTSTNSSVAYEENGVIYAKKKGNATITFLSSDGNKKECKITVK